VPLSSTTSGKTAFQKFINNQWQIWCTLLPWVACFGAFFIIFVCYHKWTSRRKLLLDAREHSSDDGTSSDEGGPCLYPPYWNNAQASDHDFDDRFEVSMNIQSVVQEMIDSTWKDIVTRDRKDSAMPESLKVVNVQRIEDAAMWNSYWRFKQKIRQDRGQCTPVQHLDGNPLSGMTLTTPWEKVLSGHQGLDTDINEFYLFHGTSPEGVDGISEGGFQLNYAGTNAGTLFGKGAYFAECASKSDEYATSGRGIYKGIYAMLLCRVCCGEMLRVLRAADARIEDALTSGTHDSVLGDREASVGTYREFVVYREKQIYPEYVVLYKRLTDLSEDDE